MYPSALFFPRIVIEDHDFDGLVVPAETPLFYTPYLTHRDPGSWDHPNAFLPERWDASWPGRRARPADLVGFGGGPRTCLGKAFAKLQLKIMVYVLLNRYQLSPDPVSKFSVQGLPVHHPVNSRIRFESLAS